MMDHRLISLLDDTRYFIEQKHGHISRAKKQNKSKTKKSPKHTHLDLHINSLHLLKQNKTKNGASSLGWQNDLTGHLFEVDRMAASSVTGERLRAEMWKMC